VKLFPDTDSPTNAQALPRRTSRFDAIDGRCHAAFVANRVQGRARQIIRLQTGSRRPHAVPGWKDGSPSTTSQDGQPGNVPTTRRRPGIPATSEPFAPQDAVGGCTRGGPGRRTGLASMMMTLRQCGWWQTQHRREDVRRISRRHMCRVEQPRSEARARRFHFF